MAFVQRGADLVYQYLNGGMSVALRELEQGGSEGIVIVNVFFQVVAEYFYTLQSICRLLQHCLGDLVG